MYVQLAHLASWKILIHPHLHRQDKGSPTVMVFNSDHSGDRGSILRRRAHEYSESGISPSAKPLLSSKPQPLEWHAQFGSGTREPA